MELKKKILTIFMFVFAIILFANVPAYAGYQEWNSLDYDVTINKDGSMDVVETWDVYVSETNTLFKTFSMDNGNYEITNVKVTKIDGNEEISLNQIFVEQYHVDENS